MTVALQAYWVGAARSLVDPYSESMYVELPEVYSRLRLMHVPVETNSVVVDNCVKAGLPNARASRKRMRKAIFVRLSVRRASCLPSQSTKQHGFMTCSSRILSPLVCGMPDAPQQIPKHCNKPFMNGKCTFAVSWIFWCRAAIDWFRRRQDLPPSLKAHSKGMRQLHARRRKDQATRPSRKARSISQR